MNGSINGRSLVAAGSLTLAGCLSTAPAPPPLPPAATTPARWTSPAPPASPTRWLSTLGDPRVTALVHEALTNNSDLTAVAARLRRAEARRLLVGSERFPEIDAEANASRRQSAGESRAGSFSPGRRNNFDLGLNFAWEIDLWGRVREGHRAAGYEVGAARADLDAARLSLAANVAKAWYNLIETERLVDLGERTRRSFAEALGTVERKFERGLQLDGALDVTLSRANLAASEASLEARRRERDQATRTLETLVGRYPRGEVAARSSLPTLRQRVPAGLPSNLLLRRPDILAAERRHAAALSRISASKKALLPAIRLTSSAGYTSSDLARLIDPNQLIWNIAAGLAQPVIDGGRRRAEIKLTEADRDEIAAEYASIALEAFREVETALGAEQFLDRQTDALRRAEENSRAAEKLALDRYDKGQVDIIVVLEAQRRAFDSEAARIRLENARLQNRIDLYLALGGAF
jgi:outer membrane protein, multidrug efflux system